MHTDTAPRLIFVNRYFYPDLSATSQMLYDLTRRLAARGLNITVVCSRQLYEDPAAALPRHETVEGIEIRRLRGSAFGRNSLLGRALDYLSFYAGAGIALFRLLRRGDVLVVKTDPPLLSVPLALVARLRGARLVNWLQDVFPEVAFRLGGGGLLQKLAEPPLRALRDASLRAAAMNVAIGRRMRDLLVCRGVPADRLCVIENWAEDSVAPLPVEHSQLRAGQNLRNHFVVAYSGNLGRAHEYATLLAAARELAPDPQILFLIIGGGALMRVFEREASALQLRNLRFLPYQPRERLADSLAAADVHLACLLPAMEGLIVPSKFYGILAAGRPAIFIGDPKGELAQAIVQGQCGAVVSPGEGAALAATLRRLRADSACRALLGRRARDLFVRQYTVQRAVEQWLELLARILPEGMVIPAPQPPEAQRWSA